MTAKEQWVGELLSKHLGETKGDAAPNLNKIIEALCLPLDEIKEVITYLRTKRSRETAEGVWLDNVGVILGLPRPFVFEDEDNIFTYGGIEITFTAENPIFEFTSTSGGVIELRNASVDTIESAESGGVDVLTGTGAATYAIEGDIDLITNIEVDVSCFPEVADIRSFTRNLTPYRGTLSFTGTGSVEWVST